MDIRKRKDTPESAIDDGDAPNRRTKLRTEEDLGDVPAGTEDPSAENATMVSTAAAASAVDASALPSSTDPETLPVSNDPAIEVEKALIAPANEASPESITAIENPDLVAAATEEIAPKIDPKPYTAEELANWNQMFFQLMVSAARLSLAISLEDHCWIPNHARAEFLNAMVANRVELNGYLQHHFATAL